MKNENFAVLKRLKTLFRILPYALLKFHKILETAAAGVLYSSVYASARDNNTSNFKSYTLSKELRDSSINVSYSRINIQYFHEIWIDLTESFAEFWRK